jgi:hypothetical protein
MEYLRLDNSFVGGINANQTLMIVIAVLAAGFIVWRHRKPNTEETKDTPNDETPNQE